jgi:hypothetical protein
LYSIFSGLRVGGLSFKNPSFTLKFELLIDGKF